MLVETILAVAGLVFFYGIHNYLLDLRYRLPPGPFPFPYVGSVNIPLVINKKPWQGFALLAKTYGSVFTFYFGQFRFIQLTRAGVIRKALVGNAKVFSDRADSFLPGFSGYCYGPGSSSGENWKRQRRFILSALREFGMGKKAMECKILNEVEFLNKELEIFTNSPPSVVRNVDRLFANALSNIICTMSFGQRFAYDDEKFVRLLEMIYELSTLKFFKNAPFFAAPILGKFSKAPMVRAVLKMEDIVRELVDKSIKEHQEDFDPENIRDFPDLYLLNKNDPENEMSYETFVAICRDLFIAGTETTATSVTWTILYLCKWPEYQIKCQEEIDKVIQTDRLPNLADRSTLVYLDAFMNEIWRHVSIAPMGMLHANLDKDTTIEGYEIPANSVISYNIWNVHNDEDYWGDPSVFRPERWIDENGKLLTHSNHFMPFGIGPRMCLGDNLARVEYFLFVTALLHRYNFSFQPGYDVDLTTGGHNVTHVAPKFEFVISKRAL